MSQQSAMVLTVKPDLAYFVSDSRTRYPDAEAAIVVAKRKAKAFGFAMGVSHMGHVIAHVFPNGIVDLTWAGSAGITCNPPKRSRGVSKEKLL